MPNSFDFHFIKGYAHAHRGGTVRARYGFCPAYISLFLIATLALSEEPKPTPNNTISIKLENEIKPQTFPRPIRFFIDKVVDRSANPQPMLVLKERGGVFLARAFASKAF